ncbi:hypothetical protein VTK73DRAFT_408 [Phialemonium thermophilum]|uniref:Topoisomerase 1-associated factor 1 n=1 Tax=Phialemonium thermophilum TaxID=223376 RepID=A0ABR3XEK9_9PEZI
MDAEEAATDIVHPEVRAHINSLVSALGGTSADDDGRYKLGDDALECLRDIKRWIRFYDEKTNRMDVARCLADANLVGGDLLPILATWPENCADNKFKSKIALACFEIMVPLTWPIDRDPEKMTVNHHRHLPVLQLAQLGYKRDIINFDGAQILHAAVRVALPSMAVSIKDRTSRDQGIIKLMLFFLRNIAMIGPPPDVKYDGDESEISRSALIDAFSYQDIFLVLLTIASNMGEDFRTEDVAVMEVIFHLVKRVDVKKLFLNEQELNKAKAAELTAMMNKEAAMLRSYNQKAPKRHNRFGTMIWVKRENGKMTSLSGQDALIDPAAREQKMDNSKTFRPPRRARKENMEPKDLGPLPSLNHRANKQLRSFVEDFLDSGFNPLFQHVRHSIDREAPHVMDYHSSQFFYLVAWFLEAERMRRKLQKSTEPSQNSAGDDISSFNLVASVLTQEMFITLNRALNRSYNDKDWAQLTTVMRCFTQILLTVQEMSESGNEDDEEIAENILSRLFYEEATHDAIANIVRTYKDQGFEYLDACTELVHTYLRILEAYSKQNVDMQVRSRKRIRRKKKAAKAIAAEAGDEDDRADEEDDSANDERDAERTSRERKFDFNRFATRFLTQGVVDTFVKFTKYYRDLDDAQLKRAHRYFYRVAFKQEMAVMLFRVDIIHLFYNMIKGPEPLDKQSTMFKDWEELVKQVLRKCIRKVQERPALITELLFSKINSTVYYLQHGHDRERVTSHPKPAAELEFRHIVEYDQQIAIAVGALLDKNQADHIEWVKSQLSSAESERRAWETAEKAMKSVEVPEEHSTDVLHDETPAKAAPLITIRPDNDARRTAMFKNPHLRLLMKLVGMERRTPTLEETPESGWVFSPNTTADALKQSLDLIGKAEFNPPVFDDESAADQLRRKPAPRKRISDEDGDVDDLLDDDDLLFPMGGPTARKAIDGDESAPATKKRRSRRRKDEGEGPTEEQLTERARKRREREREKARRIKSELYVHPSDDETDEERDREFFQRENERYLRLQKEMASHLDRLLADSDGEGGPNGAARPPRKGRLGSRSQEILTDDEDNTGGEESESSPKGASKRKSIALRDSDEDEEIPAPRVPKRRRAAARANKTAAATRARSSTTSTDEEDIEEDMNESGPPQSSPEEVSDDHVMHTDDTPLSSPHIAGSDEVRKAGVAESISGLTTAGDNIGDDLEDDIGPLPRGKRGMTRRSLVRGGFVIDSSDED